MAFPISQPKGTLYTAAVLAVAGFTTMSYASEFIFAIQGRRIAIAGIPWLGSVDPIKFLEEEIGVWKYWMNYWSARLPSQDPDWGPGMRDAGVPHKLHTFDIEFRTDWPSPMDQLFVQLKPLRKPKAKRIRFLGPDGARLSHREII